MKKELKRDKRRLVKAYWSSITAMCSLVLMGTPAFAASGGTIWDRFSSIMQDVYGQLVAISTIVAVTVAAVALIVRMVSDCIALYAMTDDAPGLCSHYYCSAAATAERTEVYVVPQREFTAWLEAEKTMPDKGVKLHDSPPGIGKKAV